MPPKPELEALKPLAPPQLTKCETRQEIRIITETQCPRCHRRAHAKHMIDLSIVYAAGIDIVRSALDHERRTFDAKLNERGWTDEMCGQCRDRDPIPDVRAELERLLKVHAEKVGPEQAIRDLERVFAGPRRSPPVPPEPIDLPND